MPRPTVEEVAARQALEAQGLRVCKECGETKAIDDFGFNRGRRRTKCKPCTNAQVRAYDKAAQKRDPVAYLRRSRENKRRWVAKDPERARRHNRQNNLRQFYGLEISEFEALLASQGGVCAICGNNTTTGKNWHVDHVHATGKVRGVLCATCNVGLGAFHESKEQLRSAIDYLGRFE